MRCSRRLKALEMTRRLKTPRRNHRLASRCTHVRMKFFFPWKDNTKCRATSFFAFHLHESSMRLDNAPRDGKTKSDTQDGFTGCLTPSEWFEDVHLVFWRHSDAFIRNRNDGTVIPIRQGDPDGSAIGRIFDCIAQQIFKNLEFSAVERYAGEFPSLRG